MVSDGLHQKELPKEGLPPRNHNADVPEHANSSAVWASGVVAASVVLGLVLIGSTRTNDTTAANSGFNAEPAMTGAAPNSPPKRAQ